MKQDVLKGEKHFTASVWIVTNTTPKKILLMHHKKLGKWTQPGGHIERYESPVETVIREVQEETGIDISSLKGEVEVVDAENSFLPVPAFLAEFTAPETPLEPTHFHIDFQYVAVVPEQELQNREQESLGIGWFTKEESLQLPIHEDTRVVIEKLL